MEKIRLDNDFRIAFTATRNGVAMDYSDAENISVTLKHSEYSDVSISLNYSIVDNVVTSDVFHDQLTISGIYRYCQSYDEVDLSTPSGLSHRSTDVIAFEAVEFTSEVGGTGDCASLDLQTVEIVGEIDYAVDGATFTPHITVVSENEINLSWTNDKGKENPETVNIKGANSFVYIASASSSTGANFTYPADITQDYLAIINVTTEIPTPAVEDFAGLWFSKIDAYRGAVLGGYTGTQEQLFLELASVEGLPEIIEDAIAATIAANDAAALANEKAELADQKATLAGQKATLANEKATLAVEAAEAADTATGLANTATSNANEATEAANTAAASIIAQTFSAVALTNPFTSSKTPRRIGDIAINSTTLEIWQGTSITGAVGSWNRISAGFYNGTVITDANSPTINGKYSILSTGANIPDSGENWFIDHFNSNLSNTSANQRAIGLTTGAICYRRKSSSTWEAWGTKVTPAELGYLSGMTGNIKTYIDTELGKKLDKTSVKNTFGSSIEDTISQDLFTKSVYLANVYGVEMLKGQSSPTFYFIGNTSLRNSILNDYVPAKVKDGIITAYLDKTNWYKLSDGTDSNIVIDGTIVTDDGSDIMLVCPKGFYAINGGNDVLYERRLVSRTPFTYLGEESEYVKAYGETPDFTIIKNGKQRSIRDNSFSGTYSAGLGGSNYMVSGNGYPTSNVSRYNYELYARAKNTDTSKNVPYANAFNHDLDVWATQLFVKFGTKDLHAESALGKGISSNDSAPTLATWGTMTGVRASIDSGATYTYYLLGSARFKTSSGGSAVDFYNILNQYRPLLKMFEAQLALSFAKANNIAAGTQFSYDGNIYSYQNIAGCGTIFSGEMTAKVSKYVSVTCSLYDTNNSLVTALIEYVLCQGVVCGKSVDWGNIWKWRSGVESIVDYTNTNPKVSIYETKDIEKITTSIDDVNKTSLQNFDFEISYDKKGDIDYINNYALQHLNNSTQLKIAGGGLHTGECAYHFYANGAVLGFKVRRGVYFGGYADYSSCALRHSAASYAPSLAAPYFAGGFRVQLE